MDIVLGGFDDRVMLVAGACRDGAGRCRSRRVRRRPAAILPRSTRAGHAALHGRSGPRHGRDGRTGLNRGEGRRHPHRHACRGRPACPNRAERLARGKGRLDALRPCPRTRPGNGRDHAQQRHRRRIGLAPAESLPARRTGILGSGGSLCDAADGRQGDRRGRSGRGRPRADQLRHHGQGEPDRDARNRCRRG